MTKHAISLLSAAVISTLILPLNACIPESDENGTRDAVGSDGTDSTVADAMYVFDNAVILTDAAEPVSDVTLMDAAGDDTENTGIQDTSAGYDSGTADIEDVPVGADQASGDYYDYSDVADASASDYGNDVENNVRVPCPWGDSDCPDGFFCENDPIGQPFCRPNGNCSLEGVVSLENVVDEMIFIGDSAPMFIKIAARVTMGEPSCTWLECDKTNPCCNKCFASLMVGDNDFPFVLVGENPPVNCMGNECNLAQNCHPMIPEQDYVIWGTAQVYAGRAQISIDGFCAVGEAVH